jgi:hypothetical protein
MPNWIQNIAIPDKMSAYNKYAVMKKVNKDGEETTEIDFNLLVPEPSELALTVGDNEIYNYINEQMTEFHKKVALKCETFKDFMNVIQNDKYVIQKYSKRPITLPKSMRADEIHDPDLRCLINYIASIWCLTHYGEPSWYTWRLNKWGCKWNACDANDDGTWFSTPWSTPYPWVKELSKHTDILLLYADESFGDNCGVIVGSKGHATKFELNVVTERSYAFACKIWDETEPEWNEKPIDLQDIDELARQFLYDIYLNESLHTKVLDALGIY